MEQNGAVQMFASYDRECHEFEEVALAREEQDFLERLANSSLGICRSTRPSTGIVVEEVERYTLDQWADIRNVTVDAVRSNVNAAREQLLAEADREPTGEEP